MARGVLRAGWWERGVGGWCERGGRERGWRRRSRRLGLCFGGRGGGFA